ncbi:MAG: ATP-binding protein [Vicinamibacterales bacterium]
MSFSSNVQWAGNEAEFRDALAAVVKEIRDQHRHQILQKLQGGRLNIQLAEADEPVVAWIEQWLGGSLSPRQLERLLPTAPLRSALQNHTMVTPDEPILVDGHVRAAEKRVGARVVSDVLGRLDVTEAQGRQHVDAARFAAEKMPMHVGFRTNERGDLLGPAVLPLAEVVHGSISGTTGSGKSFFARVLVEEACLHQGLSVLVLDPRNQFAGLLVPEDRPEILRQYEALGMQAKQARGFAFEYFAAANPGDLALIDPAALAKGRSIVSFKGLDDRRRCDLAADVLMGVFDAASGTESDRPRLLILIDEAQLLIRRRVDDDAKDAAARSELAIDRIAREGRKYGIVMILVSQSMKDFSHELANVRQMASTKIFLRNSDRELDYAADFVGDGRLLVNLPTGTALVHNAAWGLERVRVRLPLSKVCELPEAQLRALRDRPELRSAQEISSEARALLKVIRQSSVAGEPVNMSRVATLAAITSKRRLQQLVQELEEARVISTRTLAERGKPRVIEPVG